MARAINPGRAMAPRKDPHSVTWAPTACRLGTGAAALAAEGTAGYLHPMVGAVLAAADVIVPMIVALVLLTAILRGSTETCERVFRLLRWITNRAEPPAPAANP